MTKKTFTIDTSWYDAISQLPEQEQLSIYKRLFLFHSGRHEEISLTSDFQKSIWNFIEDILKRRKGKTEPVSWKNEYETYLSGLSKAYQEIISDIPFIQEKQKYYPNLDIKLTLEKAYTTFWRTEQGWNHKKKSRSNNIDWRKTFSNALDQRFNHVYKQKTTNTPETERLCTWQNTRTGETRTNTIKQYFIDKNRYGSDIIKFIGYVK